MIKQKGCNFKCAILLLMFVTVSLHEANGQKIGVKTNALAWFTASLNAGAEYAITDNWSIDASFIYNPFSWNEGRKTKVWGLQPEVRFWPYYKFSGHFVGLHGHYAMYDWGLWKYRYKGDLWGAGVSYGYAWMISKNFNVEAYAGFGYTRLNTKYRYDRTDSHRYFPPNPSNHWGLSRIGITFTYFIY